MWKSSKGNNKKLLIVALIFFLLTLIDVISTTIKLIRHQVVEKDILYVLVGAILVFTGMVSVKDRNWRYGFFFILFSTSVSYFSKKLDQISATWAILSSFVSLILLIPAFIMFNKFRNEDQNVHILAEYNDSPSRFLLRIMFAVVLILFILVIGVLKLR